MVNYTTEKESAKSRIWQTLEDKLPGERGEKFLDEKKFKRDVNQM